MEKVDILLPPDFNKSGIVKTREEAWNDEDWIGTFNLWILQSKPIPSIIYQKRSASSGWAPNKLDLSAGGHYKAGEEIKDGLREVKEELGKVYQIKDLLSLGRKIFISPDIKGRIRNNVIDVFMVIDNSSLDSYKLEKSEVDSIVVCPVEELLKVHKQNNYSFFAFGLDNNGRKIKIKVTKDSFPKNWDNYHYKIALLAKRFLRGEKDLIY